MESAGPQLFQHTTASPLVGCTKSNQTTVRCRPSRYAQIPEKAVSLQFFVLHGLFLLGALQEGGQAQRADHALMLHVQTIIARHLLLHTPHGYVPA